MSTVQHSTPRRRRVLPTKGEPAYESRLAAVELAEALLYFGAYGQPAIEPEEARRLWRQASGEDWA